MCYKAIPGPEKRHCHGRLDVTVVVDVSGKSVIAKKVAELPGAPVQLSDNLFQLSL
jgi:hypothetical protein